MSDHSHALSNTVTIAKRELLGYFTSPVAYVFIVIFLLLTGFFTFTPKLGSFFEMEEASLRSFFPWLPWLYLFLVPAVGMRLWAEERRSGTIELLFTMPITAWQAIVAKFAASWIFLFLALFLTFPYVITVNYLGNPDNGIILGAYLGSWLLSGSYLAISCLTSALTRNQVVSFILSVTLCLFLIFAGWEPITSYLVNLMPNAVWLVDVISFFSVMTHSEAFLKGLLDVRDIFFFFSLIGFCLFATGVVLRAHRAG